MEDDIETTLDAITDDMPDVQQAAIDAENDKQSEREEAAKGLTDKQGRTFDPSIHKTDREGQPVINNDGSLRLKPGHGSPKWQNKAQPQSRLVTDKPGQSVQREADPTDVGKGISESIFALGQLIGGDEWAPVKDPTYGIDERAQMYDAWGRYCEAQGIKDFPPGIAVTMVCIAYAVPRFTKPKTKARVGGIVNWCKTKYVRWKLRRNGVDPDSIGKDKDDEPKAKES